MKAGAADLPLVSSVADVPPDGLCLVSPCRRMSDIRTVICGQSHNTALWRALITPDDDGGRTRAMEIALRLGIASLPRPKGERHYEGAVTGLGTGHHIVLIWGGAQADADFLMLPGTRFDVVPRGYEGQDVLPDAQVVPEAMLRAHFEPSAARLAHILAALGPPAASKRIVLGVQPPLADETPIRQHLARRRGYYSDKAEALGIDPAAVPLAPASVRRKLWFILMELYREQAQQHGALFVPFPPAAADAGGYLKAELSTEDCTHANVRYGRLMIEHLAPHLD